MKTVLLNALMVVLAATVFGLAGCGGGGSDSGSTTTTIANIEPIANAGIAQNVVTGATVTLDGSGSSDANGDTLTYSWVLTTKPNGSSTTLSSTTATKPTFTADVEGAYVLNLIVNDGKINSAVSSVTVTSTSTPTIGTKTSYYPMTTGSTWTYNLQSGSNVIAGTFKIQADGKWKLTNNINDDVVYSTCRIIDNAVFATVQESILGTGTTTTFTMSPPMLIFPSDLTSGAEQQTSFIITESGQQGVVKTTVIGHENITVPAGSFDAIKLKMVISEGGSEVLTT